MDWFLYDRDLRHEWTGFFIIETSDMKELSEHVFH